MDFERIPTYNSISSIWNRFDILTTYEGAKRFLESKKNSDVKISDKLINEKAQGLTFCIRNAKEYFNKQNIEDLTSTTLSFYYGIFNLLEAILLSDLSHRVNLDKLEEYTRSGHGLGIISKTGNKFPDSEYIMILRNGFFSIFLQKILNYDINNSVEKRYKDFNEISTDDQLKLIGLKEVISRLPELKGIYIDLFKEQPNYLNMTYSNNKEIKKIRVKFDYRGYNGNSEYLTKERIIEILNLKIELKLIEKDSGFETKEEIDRKIFDKIPKYNSVMSKECFIKKIHNLNDPLFFNFILLYVLSIYVRYKPAIWREILEGEYSIYSPLIKNFLFSVERVIPNIVLDRLYNKIFLFAPFTYWD